MFDKYLIDAATVRNTGPADAPTGFAFDARIGYYRGLGLSMVEDLAVTLDGEALPRTAIRFDEGKGELTLDAMETAYDRRWEFGTPATIRVEHRGGLAPGEHVLTLSEKMRISYLPFPSFANDSKTVSIAG